MCLLLLDAISVIQWPQCSVSLCLIIRLAMGCCCFFFKPLSSILSDLVYEYFFFSYFAFKLFSGSKSVWHRLHKFFYWPFCWCIAPCWIIVSDSSDVFGKFFPERNTFILHCLNYLLSSQLQPVFLKWFSLKSTISIILQVVTLYRFCSKVICLTSYFQLYGLDRNQFSTKC